MNNIGRLSLLCLLLCLLNCASTQYWSYHQGTPPDHIVHATHIPVYLDSGFTQPQMEEIKAAVQEWNGVFNGQVVMTVVTHRELGVDKQMHTYPTTFTGWEAGQALVKNAEKSDLGIVFFALHVGDKNLEGDDGTLAYVNGIDTHGVFCVVDRLGTRSLKDIMMHELAHIFGALHVNAPSLEAPYYSNRQADCIDKITVLQVATIQHLDFKSLNYCVLPNME